MNKLIGLIGVLGLTFAMACASTGDTDEVTYDTASDEAAAGKTVDPLGPPQHIESSITAEHPSSNTGAGNATSSGSNTNLNQPIPEGEPTEPRVTITQTPIEEEETVVEVEEETVVEMEEEPVRTARVTTMDEEEEEEPVRRITKKE